MKRIFLTALILLTVFILNGGCGAAGAAPVATGGGSAGASAGKYALIAWNDLGMHCIDHDYSVFAILPPTTTSMPS